MSIQFDHVTCEELREQIGSRNWVLARRTPNIVARYGEDVVCLSQKQYAEMQRRARVARLQGYD